MYHAETYAQAHVITGTVLDSYAAMGVAVSRDAAHRIVAALSRDAYEMRQRGGTANCDAAIVQELLASAIGKALTP